jgi:long-chain acyl-CoA synthetase
MPSIKGEILLTDWRNSTMSDSEPAPLSSALLDLFRRDGDPARVVLSSSGLALTYAELARSVEAVAVRLLGLGVRADDRVILAGPGTAEWLLTFWGILWAGAVAVTVDPELTDAELARLVSDCQPVAICAAPDVAGALDAAAKAAGVTAPLLSFVPADEVPAHPPRPERRDHDLALIAYRPRASGDPRVTSSTWGDLVPRLPNPDPDGPAGHDVHVVCALPLPDLVELTSGCLRVLRDGGRVHCVSSLGAVEVVETVATRQATDLVAKPSLLGSIRRLIEAELTTAPIHVLALFEALQRADGHTADERRGMLATLHSRLGSQLHNCYPCGDPLDRETAQFFAGLGLRVVEGFGDL